MTPWTLPTSLNVGGVGFPIRTDFRIILSILSFFASNEWSDSEKWELCKRLLFKSQIPPDLENEAAKAAVLFIEAGVKSDNRKKTIVMDWDIDAPIIVPAVNRVIGQDVRALPYLHWWTFLGAYMEIGESLFSSVVSVREKLANGKKLEKYEKEFAMKNKALVNACKGKQKELNKAQIDDDFAFFQNIMKGGDANATV